MYEKWLSECEEHSANPRGSVKGGACTKEAPIGEHRRDETDKYRGKEKQNECKDKGCAKYHPDEHEREWYRDMRAKFPCRYTESHAAKTKYCAFSHPTKEPEQEWWKGRWTK